MNGASFAYPVLLMYTAFSLLLHFYTIPLSPHPMKSKYTRRLEQSRLISSPPHTIAFSPKAMKPEPFQWKWLIEIEESPLACSMFQGESETRNIKTHHGPQPSNSLFKSPLSYDRKDAPFLCGRRSSGNCSFIVYRLLPLLSFSLR